MAVSGSWPGVWRSAALSCRALTDLFWSSAYMQPSLSAGG